MEGQVVNVRCCAQVREKYPLTSEERKHRRRDLRRGEVIISPPNIPFPQHQSPDLGWNTVAQNSHQSRLIRYAFVLQTARRPTISVCTGGARGRVSLHTDGAFRIDLVWPEPHGGTGYDLFYVMDDVNTLRVESAITVGGRTATYNVIYRRRM